MLSDPLHRYFSSYGSNHFTIDRPFQQALRYAGLPSHYDAILTELGAYAGGDLLEITDYIDKVSSPRFHQWDINSQRFDWVQLNPAHRQALAQLMKSGIVHRTFTEKAPWQLHYAMLYLIADPGIICTVTLTQQTAYGLYKYGDTVAKETFLPRYLMQDSDQVWYGATFYTEIQGGSDLGANRAVARRIADGWQIFSEDKYFASNAGIADGALVTARPEGSPTGPKGLALFFVPALKSDGSANFRIRRLKEKLATRAVPTGEALLDGAEAYLLGSPEAGIYQALEVLTVARLANAMGALGIARKAYLEALFYTRQRSAFGRPLIAHPLVRKDLLEMEVDLEANLILGLKAAQAFDATWQEHPPYSERYHYTRLLAHLVKNMTAEMSARVTQLAMELHGGIGFLEEFPIARWHREALITPIWEGGSNIQALDLLETILKKHSHRQLLAQMDRIAAVEKESFAGRALQTRLAELKNSLEQLRKMDFTEAQYHAKDLLRQMGRCAAAAFLLDAARQALAESGDDRLLQIAEAYLHLHLNHDRLPTAILNQAEKIIQIAGPT